MKRQIKRSMKRRMLNGSLATVLALTTIPLNIFPHAAKAEGTGSTATLRILETTDLHSNVLPYDYFKDAPVTNYGLAKTATLIKQARSEVDNSMLFDAGDTIQGNPLASYVAKVNKLGPNDTHPIYKAMNYLKYDAGIVGNHEFNYGLDYLKDVQEEVQFPIVNANIYKDDHDSDSTNDVNYFTPYKIVDKTIKDADGNEHVIKVGVIGFAPPQIMQWDKDNLTGKVITKDIVAQANKFIPQMKADGADVIVAIAHSGCDIAAEGQEAAENAVYDLTKVPGIDAMLFGHAHVNFPGDASFNGKNGIDNTNGTINGVQAVEAGFWGNNLGVLDLALVQDTDGKWTVDKANSKSVNRPVTAATASDETIVSDTQAIHDQTLAYVRGKIGTTEIPMHSFFTRVMDDASTQIVNNAQMDYVKKAIADTEYKDYPVLSAAAPFKGGRGGVADYTNITKGEVTIKSAADLYLFDNTLKAVEVTGDQVKRWIEESAKQFNTIDPNKAEAQDLLDYDFRPYNYDVIDGVKYEIDVTKPKGERVVNLRMMDGTPVQMDQKFIVATNNYRAGGSGGLAELKSAKVVVDSPFENRQILMDYITAKGTINPVADNNWKIAPIGGVAKAVFHSAPEAKPYLGQQPDVKDLGASTTKAGYELYELDQNVHVQLLGINDFHGQLDTWRSIKDSTGKVVDYSGGVEWLAAYLKDREATNPANTLMLQAGDLVGASPPVSALLQDEPTIRMMNEIGMDVGTIGNHEFDEGVAEMKRLIHGGDHPKTAQYEAKYGKFTGSTMDYVVANVVDEKTNETILPPYAVKEVEGVKIGFIGVVTTETPTIVTPKGVEGVKFTDEVTAVNKYAKELTDQGVKTIVVLAHNPGTSKTDGTAATGKVVDMAKAIDPAVDVIYGAHDHKYLNTNVDGKVLVQSWSYGTAFSDIDLTIDPTTGDVIKDQTKAEVVDTLHSKITANAKIKAELDGYQEDIKPVVSQVVGTTSAAITNVANTSGESALGNLIADGMRSVTGTQLGFMNSGGIRNPLPEGTITWGDLFKVQPFGNDLVTMTVTGDQIRTLLNQQFQAPPSYNKIMAISGLKYTWSDNKPYGSKVLDIYLENGTPLDPTAEYTITVNNFMADGGDGFAVLKSGKNRVTNVVDLDGFIQYFKSLPQPVTSQIEGRIVLDKEVTSDVNEVTDQSTTVTGKTEAGATVVVTAGDVNKTTTASEDGNFSVEIPVLKAGTEVVVTITDKALNVKEVRLTVKDVTDPFAPVIEPVTNLSTEIKGHGAEPGTHVYITNGFNLKLHLTADSEGKFSAPLLAPLKEGTLLFAFSVDLSFNLSPIGSTMVLDVIAPKKAVVNAVSNKDKVVTGTAEAGSTVTVSSSKGNLGIAKTGVDGKFSVTLSAVQAAGTDLTVVVSDPSGNKSETTVTVLDKIAPVVSGVVNNGLYNKNVTVSFNEGTATLDGKAFKTGTLVATEGVHTLVVTDAAKNVTTVKFTIDKTAPKVTGVANNGLYNKDVTISFNEGKALLNGKTVATKTVVKTDGTYTLVVTDAAGNKTTVKFAIDKKAPSTPSVDKITVNTSKVTGKAEAYSTVVVKVSGKVIGSRTADKYGKFSITIAKQKAGKVVEVVAIDKAGNVSKTAKVTVK
ncbi:bifunctional 2',3'-cyclic-nucleotide 2'-phosphodiesterase/3'-nucleotidase [Bacillus sp. sid0103]|uniref:bifunctional 2',3'-cyclic-nucleotide 2'-phosphodiesterase/3'-nucleotidase n=1 Tax=Bacillus sp. sid0103 TaxID=2856337 RepID=UPI001C44A33D|nr:bifunctional 2',3'-cyclic-nucleotide 2'-phosphodiesterase/3'-nucleotidase [Bacillus sp. sid0103]MBV7505701.1 bifunctional 2',3'-cyclic-nucleotide 2'-phosphodiesterase/3'-nucleotidase [Bacillus sp. sid0103]